MLSDLLKYNQLPPELRAKISAPDTVAGIKALEKMYNVSLAGVIMKVMIKIVAINDLPGFLAQELKLAPEQATALAKDLCDKILICIADYLGLPKPRFSPATPSIGSGLSALPLSPTVNQAPRNVMMSSTNQPTSIASITPPPDQAKDLNEKLEKILAAVNIAWPSSALDSRFRQVMMIYLRGVRNKADTRQTLMKPVEVGGMGLGEKIADKIMDISATVVNQPVAPTTIASVPLTGAPPKPQPFSAASIPPTNLGQANAGQIPAVPKEIGVRDAAYDLNDLAKFKPLDKLGAGQKESPVVVATTPPAADEALAKLMAADRARAMAAQPKMPLANDKPAMPEVHPIIDNLNRTPSGKIRMDDITPAPTVLSPVGELRYMNLQKFRYLDKEPQRAVQKITQKFSSLEREGYDKRLLGLKAWRQSPVNQLYLRVCRQALDGNRAVEAVISEQLALDGQFLTIDEFNALLKLNSLYKF